MERSRIFSVSVAVLSMAAVCAGGKAQTVREYQESPVKVKPARDAVRPMPFPPVADDSRLLRNIELRSPEQMTEKDRYLEADAEAAIGERAGFADLEFNEGKWSYRQVVCPALPNHLFLRFTRNDGVGDVSLFTASVPRNGEGHVRIIPIQRRGYSLFSPAPINALTIAAFNHIRVEEQSEKGLDWLGTGLCYAALAGANPLSAPVIKGSGSGEFDAAPPNALEIPVQGGAVIRFTDSSLAARPMQWTLIFNAKGRLLKAAHLPAPLIAEKGIQPQPVDERGRPLHEAAVDARGRPLQPTAPAVAVMPVAPAPAVQTEVSLPPAQLKGSPAPAN